MPNQIMRKFTKNMPCRYEKSIKALTFSNEDWLLNILIYVLENKNN